MRRRLRTHAARLALALTSMGRMFDAILDVTIVYRRNDGARLTVALTVDHDALSDGVRRGDSVVKLSHAEFGPRVGTLDVAYVSDGCINPPKGVRGGLNGAGADQTLAARSGWV